MDTKQPEALRIADAIAIGRLSADDVEITGRELRRLHTENEQLRTCNKDAQHEIANLQARAQELGKAARDVNSRRVQELEAQLAAIGAGGVEPLRKRCLHKISEPPMTAETATTDTNTPELEVKSPAALPAKNLELLRERIEALQSEKESLYAALVKESIRAANEKLRAEKMALQHRMQADMHISACKELASLRAAAPKPSSQAQDAERYHWLRDNRNWQVLHRIRPGKSIEYRMRDDGDWWGSWWPTHEQAIDAARARLESKP